jgi:type I restriction enzyme S subunit
MAVKMDCQTAASAAVPCDWEVRPLSELISIAHGYAFASAYFKESGTYRLTTPGHFFEHGGFRDIGDKQKFYDGPVPAGFVLAEGDLIVAMTEQADGLLGSTAVIPYDGIYLHNQRLGRVAKRRDDVCLEYLFYVFNTPAFRESVRTTAAGTKVKHTSPAKLLAIRIPIPPPLEQQAIAESLSDVDELIQSIERLIAKKRDLKQAAMQQLLTGQTRLPGFSGEWEVTRLGAVSEISMGRTPSRRNPAFWGRGYTWLSIADLQSKIVSESKEEITSLAASTLTIIPKGTLLMSFKLSIGRLCFAGRDLFTNEAICSFNKVQANPEFLYYALTRTEFSLYGKQAVKGYTLNKEALNNVAVRLPSPDEQAAIAEVLSDMDAEIDTLEARLAKTRDLKQGMMQELLTGRTRLV